MDTATIIAFYILAIATIASGLGVIIFKNAVHSALSLILTLIFLALFYLQLGAMFIAIVQILIYAGAIMVLFLFVVTMLNPSGDDVEGVRNPIPWQRVVGGVLGLSLVAALSYLLFMGAANDTATRAASGEGLQAVVDRQGNIQAFGLALFHGFAFPFEVTSLLIVVSILGAMVFGRRV